MTDLCLLHLLFVRIGEKVAARRQGLRDFEMTRTRSLSPFCSSPSSWSCDPRCVFKGLDPYEIVYEIETAVLRFIDKAEPDRAK